MQDNATAKRANNSMRSLAAVFGRWMIPQSPHLNLCNFLLWDTM